MGFRGVICSSSAEMVGGQEQQVVGLHTGPQGITLLTIATSSGLSKGTSALRSGSISSMQGWRRKSDHQEAAGKLRLPKASPAVTMKTHGNKIFLQ